jgi:hypothetical protein
VGRQTSKNGGELMTRDEILAAAKHKRIESHDVPELGGTVFFAVMGGVDRDRWDEEVNAEIDASKAEGRLMAARKLHALGVCLSMANADGSRMFTDDDWPEVARWDHMLLERLHEIVARVNVFTTRAQAELEKN